MDKETMLEKALVLALYGPQCMVAMAPLPTGEAAGGSITPNCFIVAWAGGLPEQSLGPLYLSTFFHEGGLSTLEQGGMLDGAMASPRALSTQGEWQGRWVGAQEFLVSTVKRCKEMLPGALQELQRSFSAPTMVHRPAAACARTLCECAHIYVCACTGHGLCGGLERPLVALANRAKPLAFWRREKLPS